MSESIVMGSFVYALVRYDDVYFSSGYVRSIKKTTYTTTNKEDNNFTQYLVNDDWIYGDAIYTHKLGALDACMGNVKRGMTQLRRAASLLQEEML